MKEQLLRRIILYHQVTALTHIHVTHLLHHLFHRKIKQCSLAVTRLFDDIERSEAMICAHHLPLVCFFFLCVKGNTNSTDIVTHNFQYPRVERAIVSQSRNEHGFRLTILLQLLL